MTTTTTITINRMSEEARMNIESLRGIERSTAVGDLHDVHIHVGIADMRVNIVRRVRRMIQPHHAKKF